MTTILLEEHVPEERTSMFVSGAAGGFQFIERPLFWIFRAQ